MAIKGREIRNTGKVKEVIMKAFRFTEWLHQAELVDVPVPEPGHGEALIRIGGAGACHSDLHIMHEWTPESFPPVAAWSLPFTLGHENAGWVEEGSKAMTIAVIVL